MTKLLYQTFIGLFANKAENNHSFSVFLFFSLYSCALPSEIGRPLVEALMSEHWVLSELDLSVSDLGQEGALLLCQALKRPGCPMEKLGSGQKLTEHYSMSQKLSVNFPQHLKNTFLFFNTA